MTHQLDTKDLYVRDRLRTAILEVAEAPSVRSDRCPWDLPRPSRSPLVLAFSLAVAVGACGLLVNLRLSVGQQPSHTPIPQSPPTAPMTSVPSETSGPRPTPPFQTHLTFTPDLGGLDTPLVIAVDSAGNLYIGDSGEHGASPCTGPALGAGCPRILRVARDGTRTSVDLSFTVMPDGLVVASGGNLDVSVGQEGYAHGHPGPVLVLAPDGTLRDDAVNVPGANVGLVAHRLLVAPDGSIYGTTGPDSLLEPGPGQSYIYRRSVDGTARLVAGGVSGFGGDGGPVGSASVSNPYGLAMDGAGNLYVADTGNNRVRKITPQGVISTFAGNGSTAFGGDGGPAADASLSAPEGVLVAPSGDLYIADSGNHRIRKVSRAGIITTVVGTGISGDAGDGGPAARALLMNPIDITMDARGNLYILDADADHVRMVSTAGVISTVV